MQVSTVTITRAYGQSAARQWRVVIASNDSIDARSAPFSSFGRARQKRATAKCLRGSREKGGAMIKRRLPDQRSNNRDVAFASKGLRLSVIVSRRGKSPRKTQSDYSAGGTQSKRISDYAARYCIFSKGVPQSARARSESLTCREVGRSCNCLAS